MFATSTVLGLTVAWMTTDSPLFLTAAQVEFFDKNGGCVTFVFVAHHVTVVLTSIPELGSETQVAVPVHVVPPGISE